jgi:hypothetical protein
MSETEILLLLWDKDAPQHPAWSSFVRQMKNREYGRGPLASAWAWFRDGWDKEPGDDQTDS